MKRFGHVVLSLIIFFWKDFVNDNTQNGDIVFLAEDAVEFFVGTNEGENIRHVSKMTLP
jgi:hypothetical protein